MRSPLAINGLLMPCDFPSAPFERTCARLMQGSAVGPTREQFTAAWNAISFRFMAMCTDGDEFTASISAPDGATSLDHRYRQERFLFGFFSNGFSAFEAFFYGLYAIGALLQPAHFQMTTPREQQLVSPTSTERGYSSAFSGDPILSAFQTVLTDPAYREWKEVRNILTHRTAPGRTIFVSIESDRDLPPVWKINNISLDKFTTSTRRDHAARMLGIVLEAAATFVEARMR